MYTHVCTLMYTCMCTYQGFTMQKLYGHIGYAIKTSLIYFYLQEICTYTTAPCLWNLRHLHVCLPLGVSCLDRFIPGYNSPLNIYQWSLSLISNKDWRHTGASKLYLRLADRRSLMVFPVQLSKQESCGDGVLIDLCLLRPIIPD